MPWIVPLLFLYYSCILPVVLAVFPAPYRNAAPATLAAWETLHTWQAGPESEMHAGLFIRLVITAWPLKARISCGLRAPVRLSCAAMKAMPASAIHARLPGGSEPCPA